MRYSIEHQTSLDFPSPVNEHQCEMRFTPRSDEHQKVRSIDIDIDPSPEIFQYMDAFGNRVHYFSLLEPHQKLTTRVKIEVESTLENPFDFPLMSPESEQEWYREWFCSHPDLWQYIIHQSPQVERLSALDFSGNPPPTWNRQRPVQISLLSAMDWVASFLDYQPGSTVAHTPLADAVKNRAGVCQDFAHLFISLVRSWGIPARYVMGYLAPGYAEPDPLDGQVSHAWAEALIPGAGWRGFDATHQLVANDTYISVAVGRDSQDAAPQRGSFKGAQSGHSPNVRLVVTQHDQ